MKIYLFLIIFCITVAGLFVSQRPALMQTNETEESRQTSRPASPAASPCLGPGFTPGFTAAPDFPAGSVPNAIAVGDFNGDGIQDLVIANRLPDNDVSIRLGNGSGGFTTMPRVTVGTDPVSIAVGDFNGDGKPDFLTANQTSNNVSIRLGDGSGGFTLPASPEISVGDHPTSISVADLNRDGKPDFAVVSATASSPLINRPLELIRVQVHVGDGMGKFVFLGTYYRDLTDDEQDTLFREGLVEDVNGDGLNDHIYPVFGSPSQLVMGGSAVSILPGDVTGGFGSPPPPSVPFDYRVESVAVADFNGDGKPDLLATGTAGGGRVSFRVGNGLGGFSMPTVPEINVGTGSFLVSVADFNSDGKMDFATGNQTTLSIRLGDGLGGFSSPLVSELPVGLIVSDLTIGDFNNDGRPDIAAIINESNGLSHVAIRLGNCTSASVTPTPTPTPEPTPTPDSGFNLNPDQAVGAVLVQPDGKIIIGGAFSNVAPNGGASVARSRVARFNADGTLDTAFNPPAIDNDVTSLGLQLDGKVLVGGFFGNVGGQPRQGFTRLDAVTGAADSLSLGIRGSVETITVQPDGKFLLGGFFSGFPVGGQVRNYIARIDPATGLADSFNPNANNSVETIAVLADGRILAGGTFTTIGGQPRNRIARLNATTGAADSFDPNATGTGGLSSSTVTIIAPQPDGKLIVGGNFTSIGGQPRVRMARLDGTTGLADAFEPNVSNVVISTIVAQPDGRILAGGRRLNSGGRISLFNTDGTLTSFDNYPTDWVNAIALQASGSFLVGGRFTFIGGQPRNRVARFGPVATAPTPTPTPTPAPAVTVSGKVVTSDGRGLRNAVVSMTDSLGVVRTSTTSSFGFFSFDNVNAGQTYTFRVLSRLYRFAPQTVQINDGITLPDLVGLE